MASDPNFPELSRLRWRCRRGMRELDRILECFLERDYRQLGEAEKQSFAEILELPDPDLHAYLVGKAVPSDPALARVLHSIRTSAPH